MKKRLYAPGPVELPPEVLAALSRPVLHHRTAEYLEVAAAVAGQLSEVFMVPGDEVISLAASGSGGLEAAFVTSVPRGSKVLAINAGKFGERWVQIARSFGHEVVELVLDWGRAADPEALSGLLEEHRDVKAVLATHSETSTGVLHDVQALAAAARKVLPEVLFLVDAVTSLAAAELRPAEWGLDAVISGSQKGLMAPPGLAFVWLSERAWASSSAPHGSFYLDLRRYRGGKMPMTPPTSLVVALHVALRMLLDEGLEKVWARRRHLSELLVSGAAELGFSPFAERMSPAVVALRVPAGLSGSRIVVGMNAQGLTIAGGQDHVADLIIRPSILGHADELDVAVLLAGLRKAIDQH